MCGALERIEFFAFTEVFLLYINVSREAKAKWPKLVMQTSGFNHHQFQHSFFLILQQILVRAGLLTLGNKKHGHVAFMALMSQGM